MSKTDPHAYTRRWSTDAEIGFFTRSDGSRLRYLKTGTGPGLVLLHTLRTQLDYFQRLIRCFPIGLRSTQSTIRPLAGPTSARVLPTTSLTCGKLWSSSSRGSISRM